MARLVDPGLLICLERAIHPLAAVTRDGVSLHHVYFVFPRVLPVSGIDLLPWGCSQMFINPRLPPHAGRVVLQVP
jgi:hypothetical protein